MKCSPFSQNLFLGWRQRWKGPWLCLAWLSCWACVSLAADDLAQSPQIFATTTVWERALDSATAAVTVIDREQIETLGARTVAEVLRYVPGVNLVGAGSRGGLSVAQIRGGDPNFTLVLIDGVPVNDDTYQVGGVFDLEGLPAAAVERIEVVRGPFSSYYGSTGLAGVIQIFTRQGHGAQVESAIAGGDGGFRAGELGLSHEDAYFGLSYNREAARVAKESFEQLHASGRGQWSLGEATALRLSGRAARWEADDYPDASGGPVYGSGELRQAEHDEQSFGLDLQHAAGVYRHKLTAAFYRHALDRTSPAILPFVPESTEDSQFNRLRLGWFATRAWGSGTQLSVGLDGVYERGRNRSLLLLPDFMGGPVAGDYTLSRTTPGLATELLHSRDRVTIELGTRVDWPESDRAQWSPRLGLSYRINGQWRLRAAMGRAFKLPSFFALASPRALGGNPELKAETTTGGDLGAEWHSSDGRFEGGLDGFHHRYRDLVDFDFEQFLHVNRASVLAKGIEGRMVYRGEHWDFGGNVTYQDVEDEDTGRVQRHQPRWNGGLRLGWKPVQRVVLGLDAHRMSEQRDEQLTAPERASVPAYTLAGFWGRWVGPMQLEWDLRVDNLFDETYETLIGYPGPGRSWRLGLRRAWGDGGARQ